MDYNTVIEKSEFFRNIHVWPLNDVLNYKGWLNNFTNPEEKEIASDILNFFMFFPKPMINQMLKTVIGYCGEYLQSRFPDWKHDDFINRCIYSYIPGETVHPTDSGHIYLRNLRDELHISENRIVSFNDLHSLLQKSLSAVPVIFVDDFLGSGAQCIKAWNKNKRGLCGKTLKEIASNSPHAFIYAPLVANYIGYSRIKNNCSGLELIPCHILDNEYNLFDPDCICWKKDNNLYSKGIELILSKSRELRIPFSNGKSVNDVKGFGEQGLALAFDNGAPDAIPAFFYWCADNWTQLIKKEYKRDGK
jgi:hypothetical protein